MFYAPSTGGFYDPAIHGTAIPSDSIALTQKEYDDLYAELSAGKVIVIGSNGKPTAVEPTPAPLTWDSIRAQRNSLLVSSDWTQLADSPADKPSWATYRQSLRDVTSDFASPEEVVWPTPPQ
jgi:hypothetical protein